MDVLNKTPSDSSRALLLACFQHAIQAVNGAYCVKHYFEAHDKPWREQIALIAIGKAALSMTEGALVIFDGQIETGLVICKSPADVSKAVDGRFRVLESSHPVPDERSLDAGQVLLSFIQSLPDPVPLLFLISGGTSSLVEVLPEGIGLEDLQTINQAMLACGMPIDEMNMVRKTISRIKGGGLLSTIGNRPVLNLLLSDVPGNDPAVIGSGLLVPSERPMNWSVSLPEMVKKRMAGMNLNNPIKPVPRHIQTVVIGNNQLAREAAASLARQRSYKVHVHAELLTDNVIPLAERLANVLKTAEAGIHIWGAEPVVCLPDNPGRGGRNQQLALLLAKHIQGMNDIQILVAATDGNDGNTDDAGGLVDGQTVQRGEQEGMDVASCLALANAGAFLEASGDLVSSGMTGTNVMDLIIACKT